MFRLGFLVAWLAVLGTSAVSADPPLNRGFRAVSRDSKQVTRNVVEHLFLGNEGVIDINGSSPGQKSLSDVFTPVLGKHLTEWVGDQDPTWRELYSVVKEATKDRIKDLIDKGQAPAFLSNDPKAKQATQTVHSFQNFQKVKARSRSPGAIRALIVVDDNSPDDPDFNQGIHADGFVVLAAILSLPETRASVRLVSGKKVTRDGILQKIQNLEVNPEDTLFVYFVGHGFQDLKQKEMDPAKSQYFELYLSGRSGGHKLWRSEILAAMEKRNPRFRVLITDASFAESEMGVEVKPISGR
jgi:hypothetical protein